MHIDCRVWLCCCICTQRCKSSDAGLLAVTTSNNTEREHPSCLEFGASGCPVPQQHVQHCLAIQEAELLSSALGHLRGSSSSGCLARLLPAPLAGSVVAAGGLLPVRFIINRLHVHDEQIEQPAATAYMSNAQDAGAGSIRFSEPVVAACGAAMQLTIQGV